MIRHLEICLIVKALLGKVQDILKESLYRKPKEAKNKKNSNFLLVIVMKCDRIVSNVLMILLLVKYR